MGHEYANLRPFAYLNAEKSSLYRSVMRLFMVAKTHFEIHFRPTEVLEGLKEHAASNQVAVKSLRMVRLGAPCSCRRGGQEGTESCCGGVANLAVGTGIDFIKNRLRWGT
jgi:hypothetical protein